MALYEVSWDECCEPRDAAGAGEAAVPPVLPAASLLGERALPPSERGQPREAGWVARKRRRVIFAFKTLPWHLHSTRCRPSAAGLPDPRAGASLPRPGARCLQKERQGRLCALLPGGTWVGAGEDGDQPQRATWGCLAVTFGLLNMDV